MGNRVLVAMSGGVDSAVTAMLLKQQGYDVTGIHFRLFNQLNSDSNQGLTRIEEHMGIDIIYYDVQQLFKEEVIRFFVKMHSEGKTPSLCARCNPKLKWKVLLDRAKHEGFDYIATGHYVRILQEKGLVRFYTGADDKKDQSYYLWGLQQDVLEKALCPLGTYTKEEVRALAEQNGLQFLVKEKESTGLCFANGQTYNELLDRETEPTHPGRQAGVVLDSYGNEIGKHRGYLYYTVGQKKELELTGNEKLCVAAINPTTNELIADTWQNLYTHSFTIDNFCFADIEELWSEPNIQTKVRGFGLNPNGNTTFKKLDDERIQITLEEPAWAVAKGQPAVFYAGKRLLGGGLVEMGKW